MKLGIFAKTFAGESPDIVLGAAAAAGYGAVQYNMACSGIGALPARIPEETTAAVAIASKANAMAIAGISATYNMIHPDVATREAGRRSFASIAAAAKGMGTDLLTVCTGSFDPHNQWQWHPDNGSPEAWREMIGEFGELLKIAREHNIVIGVEPELANVVSDAHRARTLLDTLGNDRVRIVLDPANLFETATASERRRVIEEAIDLLADSLVMAHAKDRLADGRFAAAGEGMIDFEHFVRRLDAAHFSGSLITHGLTAGQAPSVSAFLSRLLTATGMPS